MPKTYRLLNQSELMGLCLIMINSTPAAQSTRDVYQAVRWAGWECKETSIGNALFNLSEKGLICLVRHVGEDDRWYSLSWDYGGGNL